MVDSSDMNASGRQANDLLGWKPRTSQEAVTATADRRVRLGPVGSADKRWNINRLSGRPNESSAS